MNKILNYFGAILTSLILLGCEKNYSKSEIRLIEGKFSNQAGIRMPLRERYYIVDFIEIGRERDGSLRIVSRKNDNSLVSVTLIEERNLEKNKSNLSGILSVPVKTFAEECLPENEDYVTQKLLDEAKDYRLSEDYSKKADAKVKDVMNNNLTNQ